MSDANSTKSQKTNTLSALNTFPDLKVRKVKSNTSKSQISKTKPNEAAMHIQILTTLLFLSFGILGLVALLVTKPMAKKPILIETRRIVPRRKNF